MAVRAPSEVEREGFAIHRVGVAGAVVERLKAAFDTGPSDGTRHGGQRNVLSRPEVRAVAQSETIRGLVEPVLGPRSFAVRALLFNKSPAANWRVIWHQDLSIAVKARTNVAGFGPWTMKGGLPHCLAPATVLERMLAVRIHLDDCNAEAGPLRVLPGTHLGGRLDGLAVEAWKARIPPVSCLAPTGGVVLMRPLLLHASSSSIRETRRRVLHIEFADGALPGGLEWAERV